MYTPTPMSELARSIVVDPSEAMVILAVLSVPLTYASVQLEYNSSPMHHWGYALSQVKSLYRCVTVPTFSAACKNNLGEEKGA